MKFAGRYGVKLTMKPYNLPKNTIERKAVPVRMMSNLPW